MYGIWDSVAFSQPQPSTPTGVTQTGTATLVQQSVGSAQTGTFTETLYDGTTKTSTFTGYVQSNNSVDWTTKRGWYMNLSPTSGERMVYPMASIVGRLYAAYTLAPSATVLNPCVQSQKAQAYSYVTDMLTGSRPDSSIYAGCINCNSIGPLDTSGPPTIIAGATINSGREKNFFLLPPVGNQTPPPIKSTCGEQTYACPSTVTNVKRTWRQLFLR
jgi:type IV pilus assembly protein PilY1